MSRAEVPPDRPAELEQTRRDVLRTLRHELRTPIDHVVSYAALLVEEAEAGEGARFAADLRRIHQAGRQVLTLVDDLFDLDRAAGGAIDLAAFDHELRTPLTAISGYSDLLREEAAELDQPLFLADLDKIHAAATRVLALVNASLDLLAASGETWAPGAGGDGPPPVGHRVATRPAPRPPAPRGIPGGEGAVLVVDDNRLNRELLSRRLVRLGYDVAVAEDGLQALAMLRERTFDLLLLDVMMPGLDGFGVLARLKSDLALRELPVVVVSALAEADDAVACVELGADDYLTKPVNPVLLQARIGACLEKKRLRDREVEYLRQAARVTGAAVIAQLLTARHDRVAGGDVEPRAAELAPEGEDEAVLAAIDREVERVSLTKGETLFRQGEPGDGVYVVLYGRLRVVVADEQSNERPAGEVRRGETVGELEMLTGAARSATVEAIRDAGLARIPRDGFERLAERYPRILTRASRDVVGRLQQAFQRRPHAQAVTAIALVPLGAGVPLADFARRVSKALAARGPTLHLDRARVAELGGARAAEALADDAGDGWLVAWLNDLELRHRFVVYETDPAPSAWTRRCLRQADRVLLVGRADGAGAPDRIDVEQAWPGAGARTELVLLHDDGATRATGTADWLARLPVAAHHHVRLGLDDDVGRLARHLCGGALGLVLGGGGARGFAHVGVIRALQEAGLPIDLVGGTSMGALIGGAYALGLDYTAIVECAKILSSPKRLFDYTLPVASLFTGRKLAVVLRTVYEEARIEDLWRPFFCVSSSLNRAQPIVHRQGPLWLAVRASCSIAGIFPPVAHDGDLLVDGGYLNNLPIDVMRGHADGVTVVAVNVNPPGDPLSAGDVGSSVSGWRLLRGRVGLRARPAPPPSIFATMLRASSLNGAYQLAASERLADLVINPPVAQFGILDCADYEQVIAIGYEAAKRRLDAWLEDRVDEARAPA